MRAILLLPLFPAVLMIAAAMGLLMGLAYYVSAVRALVRR